MAKYRVAYGPDVVEVEAPSRDMAATIANVVAAHINHNRLSLVAGKHTVRVDVPIIGSCVAEFIISDEVLRF